jgi:hypothetical protein
MKYTSVFVLIFLSALSFGQTIEKTDVFHRGRDVVVTYELFGDPEKTYTVELFFSLGTGRTFSGPVVAQGNVGPGQKPGTGEIFVPLGGLIHRQHISPHRFHLEVIEGNKEPKLKGLSTDPNYDVEILGISLGNEIQISLELLLTNKSNEEIQLTLPPEQPA